METGIAEVLFGALVLAVFVFLVVITVTFDSVIGTKAPRRRTDDADPKQRPADSNQPKRKLPRASDPGDRRRKDAVV